MYESRHPRVYLPGNTLFVPNALDFGHTTTSPFANAGTGANRASFLQFSAPYDTAVRSISAWCVSGTTQNFDIGLYDASGTRLGSLGSTGIASTTGIKTWTPTNPIGVQADTTYIAAFAADSNTPTWVARQSGVSGYETAGTSYAASSFPLPSTWGAQTIGNQYAPILKIVFSG